MTTKKYAIWWLSQAACEEIEPLHMEGKLTLPEYIIKEFESRYGRAGRGRLWTADGIPVEGIDWPEDAIATKMVTRKSCGGIVIKLEDVRLVAFLPGFVTDLGMNLLTLESLKLGDLLEALDQESK